MTRQDLLLRMFNGESARLVPKRIIYNEVRGEDYRLLVIGRQVIVGGRDDGPDTILEEMRRDGLVAYIDAKRTISHFVLTDKGREQAAALIQPSA